MNEKFFSLPEEKQQAILNAGYRVFSQNTYKNSPMSQIAEAAGISKSLLFHYFHNKKELYLYLWQKCADTTEEYLNHYHCYEQTDFFQSLFLGIKAKAAITRKYPYMAAFALRSFYEKDENIAPALLEHYKEYLDLNTSPVFQNLNPEQFLPEARYSNDGSENVSRIRRIFMGNVSERKGRCCSDGRRFYKINPVLEKSLSAQLERSYYGRNQNS